MITALLVIIMVLGDSASDVLMTRAMKWHGAVTDFRPSALFITAGRVLRNGYFMAGIACASAHFAAYLLLLSYQPLSFVVCAAALVYVFSTLGARWFLQETVRWQRWLGSFLVASGVALVAIPPLY